MSKGMIVVDMPEKCSSCSMAFLNEYYDCLECYFKPGHELEQAEEKPDWCPIKQFPEKANQTLCKVLERTETGWLVDLGTGEQAEIEPEEAAEMEEI